MASFLTVVARLLPGAPPAAYVGAARCATCHPEEFRRQSESGHARALSPAARHRLAKEFAVPAELRRGTQYGYRFSIQPDHLQVTVFDAQNRIDIPVQWAFGAGDQAVTFVSRIDRNWYLEHHLTYYPGIRKMAATPGHPEREPANLSETAGFVYQSRDPSAAIVQCFQCHSTGGVEVAVAAIEPAEPGVHCEACHGPGSLHALTAQAKSISNPGRMTAARLNVVCGRCHRPPEPTDGEVDWNFAWNVRHQPSYLSQSKCFRKSKGALSCLSCHRPHDPVERAAAYYNRICQSCHPVTHSQVDRGNCIDCHMPRVSPQAPLRFTNHWIGVYRSGARLKPAGPQ